MALSRKLLKISSSSLSLIIPKSLIKKYGWKEHQKLTITDAGRGVLKIRDWRKPKK